ncbi:MAG TPA: HAD hydrolase-like protein [Rubrobacter sp.]|nr:HAD hydrolase-like protein [Rubrobacteraceae bacterium]MDQ3182658.1 HAD hydrolase-like protein [Actinomycetota bacterium]MDQ3497865.1 HAD hydrolase-like protein [Actinomycetota bacterium]MDQ3604395.1 HAD hydrolase-like protein [Actinomycetota bacterium]HEV8044266.1 HAD hydrolase-like protein [Rubrobacter sp.]
MPAAALFDFDGTLVDTTEMIHQSMRHATSSVLGRDHIPRETLLANVGQPLPRQMEIIDAEKAELLLEAYRSHHEEHHDALIGEFPGVEESLSRLRSAGIKVAVVTSKRRLSVEMALKNFPGLRNVVDRFVTLEDTTQHKPHPEPLLRGLDLLGGVPKERAAYVGDSPFDVQAAKAAGLTSVAVSWGAFPEDRLREAEPDHLVPDIDAAVDVLLRM